jgi:hypothetical protein
MAATQRVAGSRIAAWSVLLVGPEWIGPADDGGGRERAEIAAVEGVPGLPVHEEDVAAGDDAAAAPDG